MTDWIIDARNLSKRYRLYARPHYRFLDVLGLLPGKRGAYTEHAALQGVDLRVRRGEKVGLIGRNGAGKSTLLKLVTGAIKPTSGAIHVQGKATALLQLGTGFHPDFTGRENVLAYLACRGIGRREARRLLCAIVEFAELEEYVDQPLRTYSSGMAARLMFAAAVHVAPDVLVLDEVLSVGDAYFARKSQEKMHELCAGAGTTVLMVSHDIYSAARICERMVWLERGRILLDADATTVIKAYDQSIRAQEEQRLRVRKQERLKELQGAGLLDDRARCFLEIRAGRQEPQPCPVYISRVELSAGAVSLCRLPLEASSAGDEQASQLDRVNSAWGEPVDWQGRRARPMLNYGSSFHKAAGVLVLPAGTALGACDLTIDYWMDEPCDLLVRAYADDRAYDLGALPAVRRRWHEYRTPVRPSSGDAVRADIDVSGKCGSGAIAVRDVRILDEAGGETHFLPHGHPCTIEIDYAIRKQDLAERAQVLVAFQREGVLDACRFLTRDLCFDASIRGQGTIRMRVPELTLAGGRYALTVMIVEPGYFDRPQALFYSVNPGVYASLSRVMEVEVVQAPPVASGTVVLGTAEWSLRNETAGVRIAAAAQAAA